MSGDWNKVGVVATGRFIVLPAHRKNSAMEMLKGRVKGGVLAERARTLPAYTWVCSVCVSVGWGGVGRRTQVCERGGGRGAKSGVLLGAGEREDKRPRPEKHEDRTHRH